MTLARALRSGFGPLSNSLRQLSHADAHTGTPTVIVKFDPSLFVSIRRGPPRWSFWPITLEQRGIVFVHFDELDQVLDAEVGERHDAIFSGRRHRPWHNEILQTRRTIPGVSSLSDGAPSCCIAVRVSARDPVLTAMPCSIRKARIPRVSRT